jgi:hypothetical protein
MKFVGFLDAKKAIRFYDPAKRTVRELQNFAFRDEEVLSVLSDVPGLCFEGELDDADTADALPNPEEEQIDDQPEEKDEAPVLLYFFYLISSLAITANLVLYYLTPSLHLVLFLSCHITLHIPLKLISSFTAQPCLLLLECQAQ